MGGSGRMNAFPYSPMDIRWIRPPVDRDLLHRSMARSDWIGLAHCLGTLAILATSGTCAYLAYMNRQWVLMALALYIHGGLFAFQPQTHEFSHNTVFRTAWLNRLFQRIFGLIYWRSNSALYKMSHNHHHRYTVHRQGDGEVVLPAPETTERLLATFGDSPPSRGAAPLHSGPAHAPTSPSQLGPVSP